jgi:hypothetical protein
VAKPAGSVRLSIVPLTLAEANGFVAGNHRHHAPVRGHKFSLGVAAPCGRLVGVAIVGRPSARRLQDGRTLEVTRVATDGTPNACSAAYSAARRAANALGYSRLITYTLKTESGRSIVAAGWRVDGQTRGGTWSRAGRPRSDKASTAPKTRWIAPGVARG